MKFIDDTSTPDDSRAALFPTFGIPNLQPSDIVMSRDDDDVIGEGGSANVYRGTFRGLPVAVKEFRLPRDPRNKNIIRNELKLLARLRHSGVMIETFGYTILPASCQS